MLPFDAGNTYRTDLIAQARESCDAARRLINIHAALSLCVLSLCGDKEFPADLLESFHDTEARDIAFQIAKVSLAEPEEEGEGYTVSCFAGPTPKRVWPYYIPAALLELSGSGYDGYIPAEASPTGRVISVFSADYEHLPNDFIDCQIETAEHMIDTLTPLTEAMADYVDAVLGLDYDGLSLWPYALGVIKARLAGEDLSQPADQWFFQYWHEALAEEDRLDRQAELTGDMAPDRVLH